MPSSSSEAGLVPSSFFWPHKLFSACEKFFHAQTLALLLSFMQGHGCSFETPQPHHSGLTDESITKPGHEPKLPRKFGRNSGNQRETQEWIALALEKPLSIWYTSLSTVNCVLRRETVLPVGMLHRSLLYERYQ